MPKPKKSLHDIGMEVFLAEIAVSEARKKFAVLNKPHREEGEMVCFRAYFDGSHWCEQCERFDREEYPAALKRRASARSILRSYFRAEIRRMAEAAKDKTV